MPLDKSNVKIGMRVQNHNGLTGTVRFMAKWEKKDKPPRNDTGTYIGVEFDEATSSPDRNDGTWNGIRHFECPPGTGEFQKPKDFSVEMNSRAIPDLRAKFGDRIAHLPDNQLVKFCIARQFQMEKVVQMIEKHLIWTNEFKPSFDEYFPEGMKDDYPCGFSGATDYDNNLLYFERPGNGGKCHPADFVEKYGLATIARWHVAGMETGKKLMQDSNFKSKRVTCIVDLTNLGDTGRPMVKFAKTIAAIDQDNYPEHLARLFIINAPSFFTAVWKLVRFFVDDRTKNKIHILNAKEQLPVLLQYIREEDLPTFAGGKSEAWFEKGGRVGSDDPAHVVSDAKVVVAETTDEELAAANAQPDE